MKILRIEFYKNARFFLVMHVLDNYYKMSRLRLVDFAINYKI